MAPIWGYATATVCTIRDGGSPGRHRRAFTTPICRDFTLRNCDVGATHVCCEVDDIDAVYADLRAKGVAFSVEPSQVLGGVLEGDRYCYFRDPDGIQLELWERAE